MQRIKRQVAEAVTRFQREQMSVTAESVWVDVHPESVVVTLRGATCPAEQDYARDRQARGLLERLYGDLFDATKGMLEAAIERILGRSVQRSRLSVDPESGDGVILFTFTGELCQQGGTKKPGNQTTPVQ